MLLSGIRQRAEVERAVALKRKNIGTFNIFIRDIWHVRLQTSRRPRKDNALVSLRASCGGENFLKAASESLSVSKPERSANGEINTGRGIKISFAESVDIIAQAVFHVKEVIGDAKNIYIIFIDP